MCLCFIDYQKAFDSVDWTKLQEMLRNIGVNLRERRLIRNLCMGQRVKLRLNQGKPRVRNWKRSHPYYYREYLMKEALAEVGDFKIGRRIINKVRFADDTAIIAKSQEELQGILTDWWTLEGSMACKSTLTNHK